MSSWIDQSPSGPKWHILSVSPEAETSIPRPAVGNKKFVAAVRKGQLKSGRAILRSPVFTASPGDSIEFAFRTLSAQGNNLQLYCVEDNGQQLLFDAQWHNPSTSDGKWRGAFIELPIHRSTNISLLFSSFIGEDPDDSVAVDVIWIGPAAMNMAHRKLISKESISPRPSCEYFLNGSGNFTSPNFPDDYPNYIDCYWHLETNATGVSIDFDPFYTELNHDFVSIYFNSGSDGIELFHGISGSWGSYYFATLHTSRLLVNFYAGGTGTAQGFNAYFQSNPPISPPTPLPTSSSTSLATAPLTPEQMSPPTGSSSLLFQRLHCVALILGSVSMYSGLS